MYTMIEFLSSMYFIHLTLETIYAEIILKDVHVIMATCSFS